MNVPQRGALQDSRGGQRGNSSQQGMPVLPWLIYLAVVLLVSPEISRILQLRLLGSGALAFGLIVFWTHGGPRLTAVGVYSLASAAFVGYAGLWWSFNLGVDSPRLLALALAAGFGTHIAMYGMFWRRWVASSSPYGRRVPVDVSRWAAQVGAVVFIGAVAVSMIAPGVQELVNGAAFSGVALLSVGVFSRPTAVSLVGVLAIFGALSVYVLLVFGGYGRLAVVALALTVAIVASGRAADRRVKVLVIVGAPLLVAALNAIRVEVVVQSFGTAAKTSDVAGSITSPLETLARLMDAPGISGAGLGSTFWATATFFVPRSLWPNKPIGFGAELTSILEPTLVSAGHSMAGLAHGEWYYNFGLLGFALMCPVVALAVRWLDEVQVRVGSNGGEWKRFDVVRAAAVAIVMGGLGDLVWVGTFTFVARTTVRLSVLVVLLIVLPSTRARLGPNASLPRDRKAEHHDE